MRRVTLVDFDFLTGVWGVAFCSEAFASFFGFFGPLTGPVDEPLEVVFVDCFPFVTGSTLGFCGPGDSGLLDGAFS